MKRLLIILLLAILPLQAAWAAACACCVGEEGKAVQQSSQTADQQQHTPDDDGDADQPCCDGGCDACHHLSASAIPSANPDLPLPKGAPHLRGTVRRYVSHIPDLIPPPDRPLRA